MQKKKIVTALATIAIIAFTAFSVKNAEAEGPINSYLIGPDRGMSFDVGSKHLVTYFDNNNGACDLTIMIANKELIAGAEYNSAARLKVSLEPGNKTRIDSNDGKSLNITCNQNAESITVEKQRFYTSSSAKS